MDPALERFPKWTKILGFARNIFVVCVSACLCLLTWPKISGLVWRLPVVCGFYLFILAYLVQNFRIRAKNLCSLCFLLVCTCLLGQKFQDSHENCLWFVVFTCLYLLTWTKISGFTRKISVVCVFCLSVLAYLAKISRYARYLPVVCGFFLFMLAYLDQNFRIRVKNLCSLCFFLVCICLLGQKFQDLHEDCL